MNRIDFRESLAGGKRQREHSELPSEHLPEKMFLSRRRRNLTVIREEDIRPERSVSDKRTEKIREQEWYRVGFIRSFVSCIQ